MKYNLNNKILEAINRGIKFALDDFEDNEIQGQVNSKVKNNSHLKEYIRWSIIISKLENEELTKQDIEELAKLSKLLNIKYIVNSTGKLEDIVDYIDKIDHNANLNWIDTSKLTDMSSLFANKYEFNGDISEWDVSNVRNMSRMFMRSGFDGDISKWNVSKVESMASMFYDSCFNNDISKWNTSSLKYMDAMFAYSAFEGDISNWDVSNISLFDQVSIFMHCSIKREYRPKFSKI